jgi:hypothetical protein
VYQHKHIRSALGYLTLAMFEFAWRHALPQPNEGIPLRSPEKLPGFSGSSQSYVHNPILSTWRKR